MKEIVLCGDAAERSNESLRLQLREEITRILDKADENELRGVLQFIIPLLRK